MLAQRHTRREGILLSLSSNRIVMEWVHAWSCIIYIRKESNVLDAENLTHSVEKKRNPCIAPISAVMWVMCMSGLYIRFNTFTKGLNWDRYDGTRKHLYWYCDMSYCCSAPHPCSSHSCRSCIDTQQHLHTSECWQWAKLGGVTITFFNLSASIILHSDRFYLRGQRSFLPSALQPFIFTSVLSLVLLPLSSLVLVNKWATFSFRYNRQMLSQHSESSEGCPVSGETSNQSWVVVISLGCYLISSCVSVGTGYEMS